jgi:hypothetical protein
MRWTRGLKVSIEMQMDQCAGRLKEILRERHHLRSGKPDDFTIQNQADLLKAQQETQRSFDFISFAT